MNEIFMFFLREMKDAPVSMAWKYVTIAHCRQTHDTMSGSRVEGAGGPEPAKNHKNIGFLSKVGPDSLKITKLLSQRPMSGHHQHASEMPFKWRFSVGPCVEIWAPVCIFW